MLFGSVAVSQTLKEIASAKIAPRNDVIFSIYAKTFCLVAVDLVEQNLDSFVELRVDFVGNIFIGHFDDHVGG